MKIAAISDDGTTISQHFGRASQYVVFNVENGKVTGKEIRPKMGHQHFAAAESNQATHGEKHGYDADAQSKHKSMAQPLADCQVLLAGGMGWGAYDSLKSYNIEPIITDVGDIEKAVKLYVAGNLPNLMQRLH
jgi:predicted Fe-Mo cluster-binding NifX family protein